MKSSAISVESEAFARRIVNFMGRAGLHPDEVPDHLLQEEREFRLRQSPAQIPQGAGMLDPVHLRLRQAVEVPEHRGGIEIETDLPATAQVQDEDRERRPQEERGGVDDPSRVPRIGHERKPHRKIREKVPDRPGEEAS